MFNPPFMRNPLIYQNQANDLPPPIPADLPQLIMKAIIVPGDKTSEGVLIEAVALPWLDIIEMVLKDPAAAFQIPPRMWEEIIAGAYKKAGFDEVTLTPRSGDLGRDVIAVKKAHGIVRVIDQVKAFAPDNLVPPMTCAP
ncbi:MAG TPA: restriction endonuclease [Bradyrhizobium sp.]|nr:restriction endonuclease [Bradyrhizobium sp.]